MAFTTFFDVLTNLFVPAEWYFRKDKATGSAAAGNFGALPQIHSPALAWPNRLAGQGLHSARRHPC
jgi:hypothetical protein